MDVLTGWLTAMRRGDFEEAWRLSDSVLGARDEKVPRHEQSIWTGAPLDGKRVLVCCYHGLGDTIQFCRYLPLLRQRAAEVIVWAQPSLLDLLEADRLLPLHDGAPEVAYDVDVEIMELPHVFRTTLATIPSRVPYLHVPPASLPPTLRMRVGLVWEAGDWDETRSIRFDALDPLLRLPGIELHALQLRVPRQSRLIADPRRCTIRGVAELMRAMDLVISVDTMTAHLAGALAVPVWTLLPYEADWRWMENRDDSPWYPTMRLFRQDADRCWEPVIASVAAELERASRAETVAYG